MRNTIIMTLAMVGAIVPMLTTEAAAKNKAEIVYEKVQECQAEYSQNLGKCPNKAGFSQDLCISLVIGDFKQCEREAHESVFIRGTSQPSPPVLTPQAPAGRAAQQ